jgi:hypothetical protein
MHQHLTDEALTARLASEGPSERPAECGACEAEEENLRGLLAEWKASAEKVAERPDVFWRWQQRTIAAHRSTRPSRPRMVWATAMAILVLVATLLTRQQPAIQHVNAADPDDALLVEVHRSVRREVPRALEPASLLTQEIDRASQPQAQPNP